MLFVEQPGRHFDLTPAYSFLIHPVGQTEFFAFFANAQWQVQNEQPPLPACVSYLDRRTQNTCHLIVNHVQNQASPATLYTIEQTPLRCIAKPRGDSIAHHCQAETPVAANAETPGSINWASSVPGYRHRGSAHR